MNAYVDRQALFPDGESGVEECIVLSYDGNKYCVIEVELYDEKMLSPFATSARFEVKAGYLFQYRERNDGFYVGPNVELEELNKLPTSVPIEVQHLITLLNRYSRNGKSKNGAVIEGLKSIKITTSDGSKVICLCHGLDDECNPYCNCGKE